MSSKAKRNRWRREPINFTGGAATFQAASGDGPPAFQMRAYNGGKLNVKNYAHPVVVDIRGVRVHGDSDVLPILKDHDQQKPIGHGTPDITTTLDVTGTISQPTDEASKVIAAASNGFPWQSSIGGQIESKPRFIKAGQTVSVNGRDHTGPVYVVRNFVWNETSVVAIGADADRTSISIAAEANQVDKFDNWLSAKGFEPSDLSQEQEDLLRAAFHSETDENASKEIQEINASNEASKFRAEIAATHAEMRKIATLTDRYTKRVAESVLEPLHAQASSGEISPIEYELALVKAARPTPTATGGASSVSHGEDAIVAAICQTAGMSESDTASTLQAELGQAAADKAMSEAVDLKNFGIHKLAFAVLNANGVSVPAGSMMDDTILASALEVDRNRTPGTLQASAGFSTLSLPGILSRVANKAMLAAYTDAMSVGLTFASQTSTNDFKQFDRYRLTEAGDFEEVGATGEIKSSTMSEEVLSGQVKQYGRMFAITRKMLINDDLGALLQVPRMLGRMAARTLEKAIISTLVDASTGAANSNFFYSNSSAKNKPNYATGATTALDIDSLGTAYKLFLDQVDSEGNPIMVEPSYLLCSNANAVNAGKLFNDGSYRFTGTDIKETIDNQWRGRFSPLVSPWLGILGSEEEWYLLPSATDSAVVNVAFLRGQSGPQIQQSDVDFKQLGIQMRGVFDFGVSLWDRRLAVKMSGVA